MRSTKKLAFLDRFYKRFCCGARNHPSGWKKEKHINRKATRRRLKDDTKKAESEELKPKRRMYEGCENCKNYQNRICMMTGEELAMVCEEWEAKDEQG